MKRGRRFKRNRGLRSFCKGLRVVKCEPCRVFSRETNNRLSDKAIYMGEVNAISLTVFVSGTNPSATISLEGAPEEGGNYLPISGASKTGVTSDEIIDFVAPSAWGKIRIASISGTFGRGQGFSVLATPFVSPGPTSITAVIT